MLDPRPDNRAAKPDTDKGWRGHAVALMLFAVLGWGATAWYSTFSRSTPETVVGVSHLKTTIPFPSTTVDPGVPVLRLDKRDFFVEPTEPEKVFPRDKMIPIGRDSRKQYFLFQHRDPAEGIGPNGEIYLFARDAEGRFIRIKNNPFENE